MNKLSALAAAAAVVFTTACGSNSSPLYGDVTLHWDFLRTTLDSQTITYDSSLANASSTVCTQSGVDFVSVTFPDGSYVDPSMPTVDCVVQGTQGATFSNFQPGAHPFVVTGYRQVGNASVALYQSPVTVNVTAGQNNAARVDVPAVQRHLVLDASLSYGGTTYDTCWAADIEQFDVTLIDSTGTPMTASPISVPCQPNQAPGVDLGLVDLDTYSVSIDAVRTSSGSPEIIWSTCRTPVDHYGDDAPLLVLPYGVCT